MHPTASKRKKKIIKPGWIYSEKSVSHDNINSLIEADEEKIPELVYSDAIRRLTSVLDKVEKRQEKNLSELKEVKDNQKSLIEEKKKLQKEIDEFVEINDNDRETIIEHTKRLDIAKETSIRIKKAKKTGKPENVAKIKSNFFFLNFFQDPFEGEKGTIAREDREAKKAREEEILINEEMAELDLQISELETLDLADPDFLDILSELEASGNPSYRRTHKIYQALVDQSQLDDELLKEQEQANLRERHHNLAQIEEVRTTLKLLKKEEAELKFGKKKKIEKKQMHQKKAKEGRKGPQNLLNTVKVNLTPYNFEKDPLPLNTKMKEFDEDLSRFSRKTEDVISIKGVVKKVKKEMKSKSRVESAGGGGKMFSSKMLRQKGNVTYASSISTVRSVKKKKLRKREAVPG